MKLRPNIRLREIAGEKMLVIGSATEVDLTKVVAFNTTAEYLWKALRGRNLALMMWRNSLPVLTELTATRRITMPAPGPNLWLKPDYASDAGTSYTFFMFAGSFMASC